jgi:hypothetical protein
VGVADIGAQAQLAVRAWIFTCNDRNRGLEAGGKAKKKKKKKKKKKQTGTG